MVSGIRLVWWKAWRDSVVSGIRLVWWKAWRDSVVSGMSLVWWKAWRDRVVSGIARKCLFPYGCAAELNLITVTTVLCVGPGNGLAQLCGCPLCCLCLIVLLFASTFYVSRNTLWPGCDEHQTWQTSIHFRRVGDPDLIKPVHPAIFHE